MAKILSDRDIKQIISKCIIDADKNFLNPNGIELRLGKYVRFYSTEEEKELETGNFLKISPGETVAISSMEKIDFSPSTVNSIFPKSNLVGFITPTTTMMREGISQVATKIDSGFRGILNWSLRNGSVKDIYIQLGEPIFKLTIFLLEENESPEKFYGERDKDSYQNSEKIFHSTRLIPSDIPKNKIVSSNIEKIDPKKQLREAGYPFDHIGTELVSLQGKFEIVSKDVIFLKDEIDKRTNSLSEKIEFEIKNLSKQFDSFRVIFFKEVEFIFEKKFYRIVAVLISAISIMYACLSFLQSKRVKGDVISIIALFLGLLILLIIFILARKTKTD